MSIGNIFKRLFFGNQRREKKSISVIIDFFSPCRFPKNNLLKSNWTNNLPASNTRGCLIISNQSGLIKRILSYQCNNTFYLRTIYYELAITNQHWDKNVLIWNLFALNKDSSENIFSPSEVTNNFHIWREPMHDSRQESRSSKIGKNWDKFVTSHSL